MHARLILAAVAVAGSLYAAGRYADSRWGGGTLTVEHCPAVYARRAGAFSANVTGRWTGDGPLRYRLNGGEWQTLTPAPPRLPAGRFTIELLAGELRQGPNRLTIEAGPRLRRLEFGYDPAPIALPASRAWDDDDLDVQDGAWEVVAGDDGERRLRPVPGTEDYDRIVAVTGAFRGGRRVETEIVFRAATHPGRLFGFGVIPLWGGHLDELGERPRRGWSYGIAWYYSKVGGVGVEFSRKVGEAPMRWVAAYRDLEVAAGARYRIVAEAWPDPPADGGPVVHRQRLKWWPAGEREPAEWLELADRPGGPLVEEEAAVALVAHRCQVEFAVVTVSAR